MTDRSDLPEYLEFHVILFPLSYTDSSKLKPSFDPKPSRGAQVTFESGRKMLCLLMNGLNFSGDTSDWTVWEQIYEISEIDPERKTKM